MKTFNELCSEYLILFSLMQTTKDHTRKLLLETARGAFTKDSKAVSMREISKLSGVGLSNIQLLSLKDDLLAVVLYPLLEAMNSMLEDHNRRLESLEIFISEEHCRASMQEVMNVVTRYRKEFSCYFMRLI